MKSSSSFNVRIKREARCIVGKSPSCCRHVACNGLDDCIYLFTLHPGTYATHYGFLEVYLKLCMSVRVCFLSVLVYMCMFFVCLFCMCVYLCVCVCVCVYLCVFVCASGVFGCVFIFVYVPLCVFLCFFMCML